MISKKFRLDSILNQTLAFNNYEIKYNDKKLKIIGNTSFVYGLGERYNSINQKGLNIENRVTEKFCNQGDKTYFPLPFFFLEGNVGFYINTKKVFNIDTSKEFIEICNLDGSTEIFLFEGDYKAIISDFISLTGEPLTPPKWIFGPWMSGHRWNSEELIYEQLRIIDELELPMTALVIEQWSDEATFYTFNQAKYEPKEKGLNYEDYTFEKDSLWPNPKKMIEDLHKAGIKVLLWQAPMVKMLEPHEVENKQHTLDREYVVKNNLVVIQGDKPYQIPDGNWFPGSMVPDFSNPEMGKWWFDKRKYLFDIGIDGFKSDGGEFIHNLNTSFYNGETGYEMLNDYSRLFIETYKNNLNKEQVLFSRAGYVGQQKNTIHWAGDQKSTWEEFRAIYNSGMTASLSGQHLWSFDIGGFAGDLPSVELYLRATQMAVFTPVMQFHSEPVGGQFKLLDPSEVMNNERSPWNIANHYNRPDILPHLKQMYWLRMNLVPYIYSETLKAIKNKSTVMKHLLIDYPSDLIARNTYNEYLFGDLLVAPILYENQKELDVYLPEGEWINIFTNKCFKGQKSYTFSPKEFEVLTFIKKGNALLINNTELLAKNNNSLIDDNLHILLYGDIGKSNFIGDDFNFTITWNEGNYELDGVTPLKLKVDFI
jgi:alpha-D-xyloside xylohydrolase